MITPQELNEQRAQEMQKANSRVMSLLEGLIQKHYTIFQGAHFTLSFQPSRTQADKLWPWLEIYRENAPASNQVDITVCSPGYVIDVLEANREELSKHWDWSYMVKKRFVTPFKCEISEIQFEFAPKPLNQTENEVQGPLEHSFVEALCRALSFRKENK